MNEKRRTIVLIHGLWVTPLIWEPFFRFYGNLGHHVLAPAWPGIDGSLVELRRDPGSLGVIGFGEVLDRYATIIRNLSEPPIIMGHCYGGLIAQHLSDQGLGAAAVVIASLPPRGFLVRAFLSRLTFLWMVIRSVEKRGTTTPTFTQFRRRFCNSLPESSARHLYNAQIVPASRRLALHAALAHLKANATPTAGCGNSPHPPLLVIGGGDDVIIPAALSRTIHRKHQRPSRYSEYKEFPGRSHLLIAEPGWQELADYALRWALTHAPDRERTMQPFPPTNHPPRTS